ncbi:MAG: hypothetical protein J0I00_04290 [Burkholderiales bacterium]|nr:hypothetical protein [Burkholderiales bacterium]MBS0400878.1 hypothetical protein [Pseudomonadota bacterium]MBS0415285.1 hypothetical protein [Pseudomonadota bacterium]
MWGQDVSALGVAIAAITGVGAFWLGRSLSRRWQQRRRNKEQAAARAQESRQARRARERGEKRGR